MEAREGLEPSNDGFADRRVTASPPRQEGHGSDPTATSPCPVLFSTHVRSYASMSGERVPALAKNATGNVRLFHPSCGVSGLTRRLGIVIVNGRVNVTGSV